VRLEGKVALVTGGARGIGRAIAGRFAAEGAWVGLVDREAEAGAAAADEIGRSGGRAFFVRADLADPGAPQVAVEEVASVAGRLDVLVNNAALLRVGPIDDLTEGAWDELMAVNARAVAFACQAAISRMREQGGGSIVNVASTVALTGGASLAAYSASKGAVVGLTRTLAIDHAGDRIRVNCLCPGSTRTSMTDVYMNAIAPDPARALDELKDALPLGRQATPEEIAAAALFLAADESSYVTGSLLVVDGGFMLG
jgi:3-oxoacyl-[acyl-carrier protein] reductase